MRRDHFQAACVFSFFSVGLYCSVHRTIQPHAEKGEDACSLKMISTHASPRLHLRRLLPIPRSWPPSTSAILRLGVWPNVLSYFFRFSGISLRLGCGSCGLAVTGRRTLAAFALPPLAK